MCTMNTLKLQLAPRAPCLTRNTEFKPLQARKMTAGVRCSAQKETEQSILEKAKIPAIAVLAAALMLAGTPDEALAARSGGRMGGSGFSSRPRSAPSMPRSSPGASGGGVRNYNYYSAPPIVSPYGYGMPMFGGGIGFFPVFGLGSFFNILIVMFFINIALQTVKNFTNGQDGDKKNTRSDEEDDRW